MSEDIASILAQALACEESKNSLAAQDQYARILAHPGCDHRLRSQVFHRIAFLQEKAGDTAAAVDSFFQAVASDPENADAHANLTILLEQNGADDAALHHAMEVVRLRRDDPRSVVPVFHLYQKLGLMGAAAQLKALVIRLHAIDPGLVAPLIAHTLDLGPAGERASAEAACRRWTYAPTFHHPPRPIGAPITLGYMSSDLRAHPVGYLIARMLELHDRETFRIRGYRTRAGDGSPISRRLEAAVDAMVDIAHLDDQDAAARIYDDGVDILIDLAGHTGTARLGLLALRPAPIQVQYLGYAGTTGAPWIDYAIVDPVVAPIGAEPEFTETLARLSCFMPTDDRPDTSTTTATRTTERLPEGATVLVNFNQAAKLDDAMIGIWLRILLEVPSAVLWLRAIPHPPAQQALLAQVKAAGVDPDRIIFAGWTKDHAAHLARIELADLALDSWPLNAHTTAVDALWMGVPVLTCPGRSFTGRVAASLLSAVGLPDLIVPDATAYVQTAVALAKDATRLAALRQRLRLDGRQSRLFNSRLHVREIEAAMRHMCRLHRLDRPPAPFSVAHASSKH